MTAFPRPDRQPVIVGVGQITHRSPARPTTPLDLIADAAHRAESDAEARLLARADALLVSPPWAAAEIDVPALIAERIGMPPGRRSIGAFSGSTPQELLAEACEAIAVGKSSVAVVVGGVADASVKAALQRGDEPLAPPSFGAALGSKLGHRTQPTHRHPVPDTAETVAGVSNALTLFALIESRLWAAAGGTAAQRRQWLGRLLAPLTEAAAANTGSAWFPTPRTPCEIASVSDDNRLVAEPYTKLMTSFPSVDMAAAVIVTSAEQARAMGVAREKWVHPWGVASCHEPNPPSERAHIERPVALDAAVERAFSAAGTTPDEVDLFDLYSCFPASLQMTAAALGIDPFDARGLTVTGGLPYFGGPGAAYVLMAITTMVERCRRYPGRTGAVIGVGGMAGKFSAGLYSTAEAPSGWHHDTCADVEQDLARSRVPVRLSAIGEATVEAGTVLYDAQTPTYAPVLLRLPDGSRTGARILGAEQLCELAAHNLVGRQVLIQQTDDGRCCELK